MLRMEEVVVEKVVVRGKKGPVTLLSTGQSYKDVGDKYEGVDPGTGRKIAAYVSMAHEITIQDG